MTTYCITNIIEILCVDQIKLNKTEITTEYIEFEKKNVIITTRLLNVLKTGSAPNYYIDFLWI